MGNPQETMIFQRGWLAGIIDGEGSFGLYESKGAWTPSFKLVNTDPGIIAGTTHVLEQLKLEFYTFDSWRTGNQRPGKRIEINGPTRLSLFFQEMLPYIVAKKDQATKLAEWVRIRRQTDYGKMDEAYSWEVYHFLRDAKKPKSLAPQRLHAENPFQGL